jgi:hypothetical protein
MGSRVVCSGGPWMELLARGGGMAADLGCGRRMTVWCSSLGRAWMQRPRKGHRSHVSAALHLLPLQLCCLLVLTTCCYFWASRTGSIRTKWGNYEGRRDAAMATCCLYVCLLVGFANLTFSRLPRHLGPTAWHRSYTGALHAPVHALVVLLHAAAAVLWGFYCLWGCLQGCCYQLTDL